MKNHRNKQDDKLDLLPNGTLEPSGMWFSAVALLAVLAAVIIMYRTANGSAF